MLPDTPWQSLSPHDNNVGAGEQLAEVETAFARLL